MRGEGENGMGYEIFYVIGGLLGGRQYNLCYFGVRSITGGIIFDTVALPIELLIILHAVFTI